jgi:hypothetical protein
MRGQEVLILIVSVISVTVDKGADGLWGSVRSLLYTDKRGWKRNQKEKVRMREQHSSLFGPFYLNITVRLTVILRLLYKHVLFQRAAWNNKKRNVIGNGIRKNGR